MSASYIEESKRHWSRPNGATTEDLILGCLQRIATATESMSKNYQSLINDRDYYKQRYEDERTYRKQLERSVAAYRGIMKKRKKSK